MWQHENWMCKEFGPILINQMWVSCAMLISEVRQSYLIYFMWICQNGRQTKGASWLLNSWLLKKEELNRYTGNCYYSCYVGGVSQYDNCAFKSDTSLEIWLIPYIPAWHWSWYHRADYQKANAPCSYLGNLIDLVHNWWFQWDWRDTILHMSKVFCDYSLSGA